MQILVFWLSMCIFTPVQTEKIVLGRELRKIEPFTFYNFGGFGDKKAQIEIATLNDKGA